MIHGAFQIILAFFTLQSHPGVIIDMVEKAGRFRLEGRLDDSKALFQRVGALLDASRSQQGLQVKEWLETCKALNRMGQHEMAFRLLRSALVLSEGALGKNHPELAGILEAMGRSAYELQWYGQAASFFRRALHLRQKTMSPDGVIAQAWLGWLCAHNGQFEEARVLFDKASSWMPAPNSGSEAGFEKCWLEFQFLLNQFELDSLQMLVARARGTYKAPLFQKRLQWMEGQLALLRGHPAKALESLSGLAENWIAEGGTVAEYFAIRLGMGKAQIALAQWQSGKKNLLDLMSRQEHMYGNNHYLVGDCAALLGQLFVEQRRYEEAGFYQKRALMVFKHLLGENHVITAYHEATLGWLRYLLGKKEEAHRSFEHGFALVLMARGQDHPTTRDLWMRWQTRDDDLQHQIMRGKVLPFPSTDGTDQTREPHLFSWQVLSIRTWLRQGNFGAAKKEAKSCLKGLNRYPGLQAYNRIPFLIFLAQIAAEEYDFQGLVHCCREILAIDEQHLRRNLVFLPNSMRQAYAQQVGARYQLLLTLAEPHFSQLPELCELGWRLTIFYKSALWFLMDLEQKVGELEPKSYLALQELDREIVQLYQMDKVSSSVQMLDARLHQLHQRQAELRSSLLELLKAVPARRTFLDGDPLGHLEEANAVLLEFVELNTYKGTGYLGVFLVRPKASQSFSWLALEDLNSLQSLVEQLNAAIGDPQRRMEHFSDASGVFVRTIAAPILKNIQAEERIYLAPSPSLQTVPFGALMLDRGFLIEQVQLAYLTSGAVLVLGSKAVTPHNGQVVLFGGIDFNARLGGVAGPPLRRVQRLSALPGSLEEVKAIMNQLSTDQVTLYTGALAGEGQLKSLVSPKILHVATHGLFPSSIESQKPDSFIYGKEMVNTGLAMAGANFSGEESEVDGVLTALEMTRLTLMGTELVVLSGCGTGLGVEKQGMGVMGMKSALFQAGAKRIIASLFQVQDEWTRQLMGAFYAQLEGGAGYGTALHDTQLRHIHTARKLGHFPHPQIWGGFVFYGLFDGH